MVTSKTFLLCAAANNHVSVSRLYFLGKAGLFIEHISDTKAIQRALLEHKHAKQIRTSRTVDVDILFAL